MATGQLADKPTRGPQLAIRGYC